MKSGYAIKEESIEKKGAILPAQSVSLYLKVLTNPIYQLFIIIFTIFFAETAVMLSLASSRFSSTYAYVILDSSLLILVTFPVLYFIMLRPLRLRVIASEEKYRSLVESTDDSIYLLDRNCRYLYINKKHAARMGLSEGDYAGRSYDEFHTPEETENFVRNVNKVFETGESIQQERRSNRDGKYFLLTLSPVKGDSGETTAVNVISKNISALKEMEDKLRTLSLTDELTGLFNRRGFFTLVEQQLKISKRQKKEVFMLYADLDNLKAINDTFGHSEGDSAITDAARLLRATYREADIISRVGGDEFVVIPIGSSEGDVEVITSRLKENFRIHNAGEGRKYNLSLSYGISCYDPQSPCSIDELLTRAEKSMYEQKRYKQNT